MSGPQRAIGIDIGGTKMAVALLDERGAILRQEVLPTEAERGFDRAVIRLGDCIERLLKEDGKGSLAGIGIGCAGPLDPVRGLINNPYTLAGWDQCDMVSPLRQRLAARVYLENDADVAAVGEWVCGAGRGGDPVVMLTFGTGIGGAAVIRGQIYRGVRGEHPELGHIPVTEDGPECYCGISGCLESMASGSAIARAGEEAGLGSTRAVFASARTGDAAAQAIIGRAVNAASTAAWTLFHTLLPERLVLGGGLMDEHFDLFAQGMQQRLVKATQFPRKAVSIVRAALGNDAGVVGAGMLAFQRAQISQ